MPADTKFKASGFTLLEILIVVVIIGITTGFALLAFGDFGQQRKVTVTADQFAHFVKFLRQQAVLETSTLGILMTEHSYQAYRYTPQLGWVPVSQGNLAHPQKLPTHIKPHWKSLSNQSGPQVIIQNDGEINPFKLYFGTHNAPNQAMVIANKSGDVLSQPARNL